jgi:hypothetical protein
MYTIIVTAAIGMSSRGNLRVRLCFSSHLQKVLADPTARLYHLHKHSVGVSTIFRDAGAKSYPVRQGKI